MSLHRRLEWAIFLFALLGAGFSGYLSSVRLFSETCATASPCPYFVGLPACYFGFVMFVAIAIFAGLHVFHKMSGKKANDTVLVIAGVGTFFSGYYVFLELPDILVQGLVSYLATPPTCVLGFFVFLTIVLLARQLHKDFVS